jgi:hypothetical protein
MAIYYVAKTGLDANPGSDSEPWLTLKKAAATIVAGDTVLVRSGVYLEKVTGSHIGTSTSPINYLAENYTSTFRELNSNVTVGGFIFRGSYINISGFHINGYNSTTFDSALSFEQNSTGCIVGDVQIEIVTGGSNTSGELVQPIAMLNFGINRAKSHKFVGVKIFNPWYGGLNLAGSGHLVDRCYFSGFSRGDAECDAIRPLGVDIVIQNCEFRAWKGRPGSPAHTDIMQVFSSAGNTGRNITFRNNLVIDCSGVQPIFLSDASKDNSVSGIKIYNNIFVGPLYASQSYVWDTYVFNNIFYKCGDNTSHPFLYRGDNTRNSGHFGKVYNNIFMYGSSDPTNPTRGWYSAETGGAEAVSGFMADYNLVIGLGAGTTKTTFVTGDREIHGINGFDPLFVNTGEENYHLAAGSPCIGSGLDLSVYFTTDKDGATRTIPWDIGTYTYLVYTLRRLASHPQLKGFSL